MKSRAFRNSIPANSKSIPIESDYAERSAHWLEKSQIKRFHFHRRRRERQPVILNGHGASLRIDRGTLFIRNGLTHYPQEREEHRFFRGDLDLPTSIILVDCSGSISFDVLAWLAQQNVPLVQLDWRGDLLAISTQSGYSANRKLVEKQQANLSAGNSLQVARQLICKKLENSISTIRSCAPKTEKAEAAIRQILTDIEILKSSQKISLDKLLGIEGRSAAPYFRAWLGTPIKWKSLVRKPIPSDWHRFGWRLSPLSGRNRDARHPVNAILNYAYAVAKAQLKIQILADGYDPTIGLMHRYKSASRDNLVLDLFEPLRPILDQVIFEFVQDETFSGLDFRINSDGICRINPQLARRVVRLVEQCVSEKAIVLARELLALVGLSLAAKRGPRLVRT